MAKIHKAPIRSRDVWPLFAAIFGLRDIKVKKCVIRLDMDRAVELELTFYPDMTTFDIEDWAESAPERPEPHTDDAD